MTRPDPAPHVQAAFINALREEGTREEICDKLQLIWNELMQARQAPASPAAPETAAESDRLTAVNEELLEALRLTKRLIDEALPKFNWGASALDAHAISLLNQAPRAVNAAIAKAEAGDRG
jgi:hypothetical protein